MDLMSVAGLRWSYLLWLALCGQLGTRCAGATSGIVGQRHLRRADNLLSARQLTTQHQRHNALSSRHWEHTVERKHRWNARQDELSVTNGSTLHSQSYDIFMYYMPKRDLVVCGCGKCGSTSMFEYIYKQEFGEAWNFKGQPYPQDVESDRWAGRFVRKTNHTIQEKIMRQATSFALIRDPKERLVSAWKSKITCDDVSFGVDAGDRSHWVEKEHRYRGFVSAIQRLRGQNENVSCLTLEDFAQALVEIHKRNMTRYLDRHFLPQHMGCFKRHPPNEWTKVATVRDREAFKVLAERLSSTDIDIPGLHASPGKILVTEKANALLDQATKKEYQMLEPYLKAPSAVQAGALALLEVTDQSRD